MKVQEKYRDQPVVFLGATREGPDRRDATVAWLERYDVSWPNLIGSRSSRAFGVRGIPTTFVVGGDGRIVWHDELRTDIEAAIDEALSALRKQKETPEPPPYTPPPTQEEDEGRLRYVDPPTYGQDDVLELRPGTGTPEAAVVHYFASRMRRDDAFEEVLPPAGERGRRLARKLAVHDTWEFRRFRLVTREAEPDEEGYLWLKVHFEVRIGGKVDAGTDDVGVKRVGERWLVVSVPT